MNKFCFFHGNVAFKENDQTKNWQEITVYVPEYTTEMLK